ncbi:MAG TPA: polymer-forming cytoskeletal protein [Bryobacteraceae bacterium]|nr:polymer-forming cytoskeletal protein [Bryobacteraceae bacterium]
MSTPVMNAINPSEATGIPPSTRQALDPGAISTSMVGSAVTIGGDIFCKQDLFVDGEVNGTLNLPEHKLTVGPSGNVKANIKAHNVIIVGRVEGTIEATERVELRGKCQLTGDVKSPRISIENGAFIKGTIEVLRHGR